MRWDRGSFSRRRVVATTLLCGLSGGLAGCNDVDLAGDPGTGSGPVPEPDEPPEPLEGGLDVDALRDRTARAIAEQAFSVTGVVSQLQADDEVRRSEAKRGRGNPDAETAMHVVGRSQETDLEGPSEAESVVRRYFGGGSVFERAKRGGDVEHEHADADYSDFAHRVVRDLDSLHEVGTYVEFGDPEWDEDEAAYHVEGVGLEGEDLEDVTIESCLLSIDADGVVVGIEATLSFESDGEPQTLQTRIDGAAGIDVTIEEPDWVGETREDLPEWTHRTGKQPYTTLQGERVYVSSSSGVAAVDRFDGERSWQFEMDANRVGHDIAGDAVLVGADGGEVFALERTDGSERWNRTVDNSLPMPIAVVDDLVVFAGLRGAHALALADGSPRWSFDPDVQLMGRTTHDDVLYVGDTEGTVYAVDLETGTVQWRFEAPTRNWVNPRHVEDGQLYAGGFQGGVYCVDTEDGDPVWRESTAEAVSSTVVADGTVYAGNGAGEAYALDAEDGTEVWHFEAGDTARVHPDGGAAYVASHDGTLYRLSEDGTEEWSFETGGWVEHPTITDDAVYVGSRDANLYAIDPADGTEYWAHELNFWARRAPVVREDLLYATDLGRGGGIVYALEAHEA